MADENLEEMAAEAAENMTEGNETTENADYAAEAADAEKSEDDAIDEALEALMTDALKDSKVTKLIGTKRYFDTIEKGKEKPKAQTEADYMLKITEAYEWNINLGETVFVNSGSKNFNTQFAKAMASYIQLEKGEFPILLYDKTVRMSAKYGFVLTNRYIHIHTKDILPYKIKLSRIQKVIVDFGATTKDWSTISIKQKNSKKVYPVFKSLNAERVIELADVYIRMIYHMLPRPHTEFELNGTLPQEEPAEDGSEEGKFGQVVDLVKRKLHIQEKRTDSSDRIWTPRKAKRSVAEGSDNGK